MNGVCECGHEPSDHNGPIGDCQGRCLCDQCPDDTGNDCWCAGFRAKEPTQFFPPERSYFGPDLTRVNNLIRQHCGPYEAREEFADICEKCGGYRENAVCHHVGRFTACHDRDPLLAGGQCTQPVGHEGVHRNNTGLFWK